MDILIAIGIVLGCLGAAGVMISGIMTCVDAVRYRLLNQVKISDSGQLSVSLDAVRELPSFQRDLDAVKRIREKVQDR